MNRKTELEHMRWDYYLSQYSKSGFWMLSVNALLMVAWHAGRKEHMGLKREREYIFIL